MQMKVIKTSPARIVCSPPLELLVDREAPANIATREEILLLLIVPIVPEQIRLAIFLVIRGPLTPLLYSALVSRLLAPPHPGAWHLVWLLLSPSFRSRQMPADAWTSREDHF